MKAEYCPAVMDNMATYVTDCNANLKISGKNSVIEESEVKDMKNSGCQSSLYFKKLSTGRAGCKNSRDDEQILASDPELISKKYADLEILPEDDLLMIRAYCSSAGEDGHNISVLSSFADAALKKYEGGDMDGFYETMESFYSLYDDLSNGRGGRLYPSGDYLLFLYEPVQIHFSNSYI